MSVPRDRRPHCDEGVGTWRDIDYSKVPLGETAKRILILDWRDPFHPLAGGAERITQKYAEYWAGKGHKIYWLSNRGAGQSEAEESHGVCYHRAGPALTGTLANYLCSYLLFLLRAVFQARRIIKRERIDVVIDQIHGLPYFSPIFSRVRNVLMVCEVAGLIWDRMFPFPISTCGKFLERAIYSLYRGSEIWAISENTRRDILELTPGRAVEVLPLGVDPPPLAEAPAMGKFTRPSAVFVARLVPMKGVESAIDAAKQVTRRYPDFHLYIVGSGNEAYVRSLKEAIVREQLAGNVTFTGFIGEREKFELLRRCHFLFNPSHKEGWGITIVEAGLSGTPAIVRAGSSMDSLVRHGVTGYQFEHEEEMAAYFIEGCFSQRYASLADAAKQLAEERLWSRVLGQSSGVTGL